MLRLLTFLLGTCLVGQEKVFNFDSFSITCQGEQSSRPRHIFVQPGTKIFLEGALGRKNHTADGNQPFNQNGIPFHTTITGVTNTSLNKGEWLVVASPRQPAANQQCYIEEAVLVEAGYETLEPYMNWPSIITGATVSDVHQFLDNTHFWIETRAGWAGRRGHAYLQQGDEGYGAWMSMYTNYGMLLLISDLPPFYKWAIQHRLILHAKDLNKWNISYSADGGHGNGRWPLYKIGKAAGINMISMQFSELQQVYRRSTVPSTPNYPQPDWRIQPGLESLWLGGASYENYRVCCTANRWAGGVLTMEAMGWLSSSEEVDVATYTRWYLNWAESLPVWQYAMHTRTRALIQSNKSQLGL